MHGLVFDNARKSFPKLGGIIPRVIKEANYELHKEYAFDPFAGV